jgi:hypothetical protein
MCTCNQDMHALLCQQNTCTFARMQLRRRCAAADQVVEPMQLAKHAKVLTDTFRARKRLVHEVHAVHGKGISTRAVSKETTTVTSANDAAQPAAPEPAAIVRRRKVAAGVSAEDAAPGKAETATSTEAPPKRRKRVVRAVTSPTKAAAAAGIAEAVLNTAATPTPVLPPLDPEGITAGLAHLTSVNERALAPANAQQLVDTLQCCLWAERSSQCSGACCRFSSAHCRVRSTRATGAIQRQHVLSAHSQHRLPAASHWRGPCDIWPLPARMSGTADWNVMT